MTEQTVFDSGKILVLSPTPTQPTTAGNRRRILALLESFEELGLDFHFGFLDQEPGDLAAMRERWSPSRFTCIAYRRPRHPFGLVGRVGNAITRRLKTSYRLPMHIDDWASPEIGPVI